MTRRTLSLLALLLSALAAAGCGGQDEAPSGSVAASVREQLRFVDPDATSVVAVDLRYDGPNWRAVKPLIGRVLGAYRDGTSGFDDRVAIPPNADGALAQASAFVGLRFEEDVKPVLDGHLVVGTVEPPRRAGEDQREGSDPDVVLVYRTRGGDLRRIGERVFQGARPEPLRGYRDTVLLEEGVALVGRDTVVAAFAGGEDAGPGAPPGGRALRAALDRAKAGGGYPVRSLEQAERDAAQSDPLILASGGIGLARTLVAEPNLRRGQAEVPYVRAIRRGAAAVDVEADRIKTTARLITDRERLREQDLPVAAAGELELPQTDAVAGGSRDQSRTTTFAARVARSLFPDSRFVKAVTRAERDLGRPFEDEVLRQFSCPSVSVLDPQPGEAVPGAERFAARSCVRDPARMRELLPKLRPHLPAILTGLQGLGDEGLIGLLLIAPDAPLTPGALLADIGVKPISGGAQREQLYEISGLRDDQANGAAQAGPDSLVFGLIGDAFVVASDRAMARRAARLETEPIDEEAGSAIRIPFGRLLAREREDAVSRAFAQVLGDFTGTISADPGATVARGELALTDE